MGENGRHPAMVIGRLEATMGRGWLVKKRRNTPHLEEHGDGKTKCWMIRGENWDRWGNYPNP
jgi:hypothetical protein